jgi:hypothetical protein
MVHRRQRKMLEPLVAFGTVKCARCGRLIGPDGPWDLGHVDGDKTRYAGPEHRRCTPRDEHPATNIARVVAAS